MYNKYINPNKTSKRRTKRVARNNGENFNPKSSQQLLRSERQLRLLTPGRFAPDKTRVRLVYQDTTDTRTVTSSNAMNWGYRSSAYDPDPAALSGSIPGFVELANLYTSYCVHAMHLQLEVANQNSEAAIIVVWPSNVLHNTNSLTKADLAEYSGNVRAQSHFLGNSNGINIMKLQTTASGIQLVGPRFKSDLDYSASTSTNPVEMYNINIGAYCPFGNFTYALGVRARVIYDVEFFRLRQLES